MGGEAAQLSQLSVGLRARRSRSERLFPPQALQARVLDGPGRAEDAGGGLLTARGRVLDKVDVAGFLMGADRHAQLWAICEPYLDELPPPALPAGLSFILQLGFIKVRAPPTPPALDSWAASLLCPAVAPRCRRCCCRWARPAR